VTPGVDELGCIEAETYKLFDNVMDIAVMIHIGQIRMGEKGAVVRCTKKLGERVGYRGGVSELWDRVR
jgi:hypothetical protein